MDEFAENLEDENRLCIHLQKKEAIQYFWMSSQEVEIVKKR